MIPTRQEAERLLLEAKAHYDEVSAIHGHWDGHSRTAARCAEAIAARCPGLDADKAYVLGLLHDIGRRWGDGHLRHVWYGWKYMDELGYDEAARICLTHSFQIQRLDAYIGQFDIPPEAVDELGGALAAVTYDDYDRLIQLCDTLAGPDGPVDMAARMEDVRRRYSAYPQDKWDKNFELRRTFEQWAGADIYAIVGAPA
ncbi:MAG TPA: HD domain-containing protein [Candidatus Faecalibacterium faecipullorum]|uniref:HD domain-containing protein n=1 Tax=Candidatus Faecalibacterium faecipullorum TaxID=2838578 RepID=A0A9D2S7G3_9FIRM|nr:HD domain-containing protein [Candidatus Faecalibacterium faecipullorum]